MLRALDTLLHSASWLASHKLVKDGRRPKPCWRARQLKLAALGRAVARQSPPAREEVVTDRVDVTKYPPNHAALMEQMFDSGQSYVPARYDGAVQVYAAKSEVALNHLSNLRWGWRHIAPYSRIKAVAGAHQTLFQGPGGDVLAAHLAQLLAALGAA